MKNPFRAILFFLLLGLLSVGVMPAVADSPDNLAIMTAQLRTDKGETITVFSTPDAKTTLGTANSGDTVFVVGKKNVDSDSWYEIRTAPGTKSSGWPGSGWIPTANIETFDSPTGDKMATYAPEYFYPSENRLGYRLTLDYGHYPKLCFSLLGKALKHEQAYSKNVTDYLKYRHLLVMLVRTTNRVQGGELAAVTVDPRRGNDVSFGPLRIGGDATGLKEIFPEYSGMDGIWIFGNDHRFRFTVSDGLIRSMQYGNLLAPIGFSNSDIFYSLPVEAKAGYSNFFGYLEKTIYRANDLKKMPWTEVEHLDGNLLRLSGGQDAPDLVLSMVSDGNKWDAHIKHCVSDTTMCQEFETYLPTGGRLMTITPKSSDDSAISAFQAELDPYFKARLDKREDLSDFMQKLRNLNGVYRMGSE